MEIKDVVAGLRFPEGPRWHEGRLWLSDVLGQKVLAVTADGEIETIAELDDTPSGLGFLPDGTPVVVSQRKKLVLRLTAKGPELFGDLSWMEADRLNDMHVDQHGRAYVGAICPISGIREGRFDEGRDDSVALVEPGGESRLAAEHLIGVNGMAMTAAGDCLIVAETRAHRLTAFDVSADGTLSNRREYANTGRCWPDGIALDADGGVWLGSPFTSEFSRVLPSGDITDVISLQTGEYGIACAFGGDGRDLYLLSAETSWEQRRKGISKGQIRRVRTAVPGVEFASA